MKTYFQHIAEKSYPSSRSSGAKTYFQHIAEKSDKKRSWNERKASWGDRLNRVVDFGVKTYITGKRVKAQFDSVKAARNDRIYKGRMKELRKRNKGRVYTAGWNSKSRSYSKNNYRKGYRRW